ncbi:MAG: hypothetical protein ABI905_14020 [Betaproteobacteria bacterium]
MKMCARKKYPLIANAIVVAIACNFLCGAARAAEEENYFAPIVDANSASDTDGFRSLRFRAGALARYENQWSYAGAVAQTTHYSQENYKKDVAAVLGVYRDQRRDNLAGVDIEAGVARVSGRLRPVGDMTLRLSTTLHTAIDLNASADLVETPKALDRAIGYTFVAAGIEQQLDERFTFTGLAGWQHFSDGNSRPHLRARLIWLAVPEQGITLQARYRQYWSRELDVGRAYFNPEDYRQWLGVIAIRKRHAGWVYSGALGAGQETSTGAGTHPAYLAEARIDGPIGPAARLVIRAAYNRSAGFIDSPDYASRMIGASVVVPFR